MTDALLLVPAHRDLKSKWVGSRSSLLVDAVKELDTIATDHPEDMRAVVAEVERLALRLVAGRANC